MSTTKVRLKSTIWYKVAMIIVAISVELRTYEVQENLFFLHSLDDMNCHMNCHMKIRTNKHNIQRHSHFVAKFKKG
jgi:hypothetical protein